MGSARIGATLGRQTNAVRLRIVRSQLRRSKTACDIHAIVVAAQHKVLTKEKILNEAVRFDRARKVREFTLNQDIVASQPKKNWLPKLAVTGPLKAARDA